MSLIHFELQRKFAGKQEVHSDPSVILGVSHLCLSSTGNRPDLPQNKVKLSRSCCHLLKERKGKGTCTFKTKNRENPLMERTSLSRVDSIERDSSFAKVQVKKKLIFFKVKDFSFILGSRYNLILDRLIQCLDIIKTIFK